MPDATPNAELLAALGRLVRGLSALFWGLPIALVTCVYTVKGEWLRPLHVLPAVLTTGLLFYGVDLLGTFQKQEHAWRVTLDRARTFALINVGLAPFLYWWNKVPNQPFYLTAVQALALSGLLFLYALNPVLKRLAALLPDETLRQEARLFTTLNRCLLLLTLTLLAFHFGSSHLDTLPQFVIDARFVLNEASVWLALVLVLLPAAITMAMIWKTKEVIFTSVFGGHH